MTVITGKAIRGYQALVILSALGLLSKGIQPTSGYTKAATLKAASRFTGRAYKRSEIQRAIKDMSTWIEEHRDDYEAESL